MFVGRDKKMKMYTENRLQLQLHGTKVNFANQYAPKTFSATRQKRIFSHNSG